MSEKSEHLWAKDIFDVAQSRQLSNLWLSKRLEERKCSRILEVHHSWPSKLFKNGRNPPHIWSNKMNLTRAQRHEINIQKDFTSTATLLSTLLKEEKNSKKTTCYK